MAKIDLEFQKLCKKIKREGKRYLDKRRNTERLQIPSYTFKHYFKDGFPAITNKKLYFTGVVAEMLWFLRGDNDVEFLNKHGVKFWNKDAYNWYIKNYTESVYDPKPPISFKEFDKIGRGSVGQNYSVQWRNFNRNTDQIKNLVKDMDKNIMGSRLKVNAWNPSETHLTALPPCHSEFQIIGIPLTVFERFDVLLSNPEREIGEHETEINEMTELHQREDLTGDYPFNDRAIKLINKVCNDQKIPKFGFELHWNQRSVDVFLGLPINIASYGLLAKILEDLTGYPALGIEGTLKCVHFYKNQYEAVGELLKRDPNKHDKCNLEIKDIGFISSSLDALISSYEVKDFTLKGYTSDKTIKVQMLAPDKI